MIITTHNKSDDQQTTAHNDDSDLLNDEIGENSGDDTLLAEAAKADAVKTKASSNTQSGPNGENL